LLNRRKGNTNFTQARIFKKTLRQKLENGNIAYIHIKSLGSPSFIRKKLKLDLDYNYFFKAYNEHLSCNMDAIKEVHKFILDENICIMCFERLSDKCHRRLIANKVKEYNGNGLRIRHI
jgi:uncharacterized protein (DUF488 family)